MGKFFSDEVEQALELIYYKVREQRGKEGFALLEKAYQNGDADAAYLLSRCYSGPQYVWKYHGFPEDDDAVERLIHESIRGGSAMGVLGAMRCGEFDEQAKQEMPFADTKEVFNIIYEKAEGGEPFCQHMIGNVYFWGDILEINGEETEKMLGDKKAFGEYLVKLNREAIVWLEKAFANGCSLCGNNLYKLYHDGNDGILPVSPKDEERIHRLGAELGYPMWQEDYGWELWNAGNEKEAVKWWNLALEGGQLSAYGRLGTAAKKGKGMEKNISLAVEYFKRGMEIGECGCCNQLGELYFQGLEGVPQDYAKAVECFEISHKNGSDWGNDMLAAAKLRGLGCAKDAAAAKQLLEEASYTSDLKNYGLGVIYAQGLGVPQDIKKGVEYLDKAQDLEWAREERAKYKKGFLGKWSVINR
ncbi:MAG: sel1 repeat family protein [Roseburia sp.]|nr:sel1 repeat family protein [Roseburia sp.]